MGTVIEKNLVIVGAGMATAYLLEKLISYQASIRHPYKITVISDEPTECYNRILLSSLLAGEKQLRDLQLLTEELFNHQQINFISNTRVIHIDTKSKVVELSNGSSLSYYQCILACGSSAFIPDIVGKDFDNVIGFRNLHDVNRMLNFAAQTPKKTTTPQKAVVIGGGLLGLEAAHGLNQMGIDVSVVHRRDYIMNRQLDTTASKLLQTMLEKRGVRFALNCSPAQIHGDKRQGNTQANALVLDNGKTLPVDLLIFAAGITPNIDLAEQSGLKCHKAICVDNTMQSSHANIYAIGECAEVDGRTFGLVEPVRAHAEVLAKQLCGEADVCYTYHESPTQLKVSGIDLFSAGDLSEHNDSEDIILRDDSAGIYRRLKIQNNTLIAAILLGDKSHGYWYADLIKNKTHIAPFRHQLMFGPDYCELNVA